MQRVMPVACSRGQRSLSFTEKLDSSTPAASSGPANKSSTPAALLEPLQARGCLRVWIFFHWSLIKPGQFFYSEWMIPSLCDPDCCCHQPEDIWNHKDRNHSVYFCFRPSVCMVGEWINKLWYIRIMEYYTVLKGNKLSNYAKNGGTLNAYYLQAIQMGCKGVLNMAWQ
ncbi:toll-like receptor 10 isoform X2 [Herpailurus yagouaroundi]|uniref:toll-like receptor 10 isoform X2 n=1 Tax=Herpailurus yagouaroundi TaxID=1608482 RepID=UPI001AD753F5|nr:toll-like receptor 10 isoform X2 [Puma yagouaroundi]